MPNGSAKKQMRTKRRKPKRPEHYFVECLAAPRDCFAVPHHVSSSMALPENVCENCGGIGYVLWLNNFYDIYVVDCRTKTCRKAQPKEHWPEFELRATGSKTRGELLGAGGSRLPCDAISGTVTTRNDQERSYTGHLTACYKARDPDTCHSRQQPASKD